MVAALVSLSTYCLIRACPLVAARAPALRWWVGYLAATAAAGILHEFAVLALLAHAITLLISRMPRRVWRWWGVCAVLCLVVVAPLAIVSRQQSSQVRWLNAPDWSTVADVGRSLAGTSTVAVVVLLLLAVVAAIRMRPPERPEAEMSWKFGVTAIAVPMLVIPATVLLLASQVQPIFVDRYVFFSVTGIPLLAGVGLTRLVALLGKQRVSWAVGTLVVIAIFCTQLPALRAVRSVDSRTDDLAGAARAVADGSRPGDAVLFLPSKFRAAALGYPAAFKGLHDVSLEQTAIQAENLRGKDKSSGQTIKSMLQARRIWVLGRTGLKLSATSPGTLQEKTVLHRDFQKIRQVNVHGLEVALFVRLLARSK